MPLTSTFTRIAFAPADPPGGGDASGGPPVQRPLVPGIPSRRVDPNGVVTQQPRHRRPNQQQAARHTVAEEGELVVGQGITVKGGIRNCRRLVVHGTVRATVPARGLEVGPDGVVEGRIEVAEATVAGRFDGDLIVDGPLTVAPGGLVKGRVRYRTLTVEAGGHVSAEIDQIDNAPLPAADASGAHASTVDAGGDPAGAASGTPAAVSPAPVSPAAGDAQAETAPAHASAPEAGDGGTDTSAPEDAVPTEPVAQRDDSGMPPAFNGLGGLTGPAGEPATDTGAADTTAVQADAAADDPAEDADQDAERFYRSLARTSARA